MTANAQSTLSSRSVLIKENQKCNLFWKEDMENVPITRIRIHSWTVKVTLGFVTDEPCSHQEVCISLRSSDDNIHPDSHGFWGRSHHVINPVMRLHTKRQGGVWALMENKSVDGTRLMGGNKMINCNNEHYFCSSPCVRSLGGRNTLPQLLGSR